MDTQGKTSSNMQALAFVPLAIGLNVGIGAIVKVLNLPFYFDSVGTILATLLLGWRWGAVVGVLGFVITSVMINPFAIYFIGTQVAIAVFVHLIARKGGFRNVLWTAFSGICLGMVAAIVSAPVIIWVFGGATGNGAALVTTLFVEMGNQIIKSVFLSGFSIEPIDKGLQCIMAFFLLKGIPKTLLQNFRNGSLTQNRFV